MDKRAPENHKDSQAIKVKRKALIVNVSHELN